jgi:GNAT superfamily N-acetyltransferase
MAVGVDIRALSREELDAVTNALPGLPFAPVNKHLPRLQLQEEARARYLVAWRGNEPVGQALVHLRPNSDQGAVLGCAELEDLFVRPDARGRGVGAALLAAAEREAAGSGVHQLGFAVSVSNPHNDAARRLYERCGYRDAGLGEFNTGYTYWDEDGQPHRDEESHRYLCKRLARTQPGVRPAED